MSNVSMLPAVFLGIQNSVNPYALSTLLIFILLVSVVGSTRKRIYYAGSYFIFLVFVTTFNSCFGTYDAFYSRKDVDDTVRMIYCGLAFLFVLIGVLNCVDWWKYKSNKDTARFLIKLPSFLREHKNGPKNKIFAVAVLSLVMGSFCGGGSAGWPQGEYLHAVLSYMFAENDAVTTITFFALYSLTFILPLIIAWYGMLKLRSLSPGKQEFSQRVSFFKIISGALFLSVGTGLIYFYFK